MRITVDVDEKVLKAVKRFTKIEKSSPAVEFVMEDWVKERERKAFVKQLLSNPPGYSMTNDELERRLYGVSD